MNNLTNALQGTTPIAPVMPPPKPELDFKPLVESVSKEQESSRGGLTSEMITIIQKLYAQEKQQQGTTVQGGPSGLKPGWGGEGR